MDLTQIQHFCAYQERCHSEVRSRLLQLGFRGEDLEEAVAALVADDFLNEERYAKAYCGGKFRVKQWGRNKIRQSLQWKQVSDYCIRKGMEEIPEEDYHRTLRGLALKKWEELNAEKNAWIRKQKVQRYLLQKGYEADLVRNSCEDLE
jgi:regulatory protein